jgi:hypothetical protein
VFRAIAMTVAAVALTGCNVVGGLQPPPSVPVPAAAGRTSLNPNVLICLAPFTKKPGIWRSFSATGFVRRGRFVPDAGTVKWLRWRVARSSQQFASSQTSASSTLYTPRRVIGYVYTGTYAMKKNGRGCFDLWTSLFTHGLATAAGSGYPQFSPHVFVKRVPGQFPAKLWLSGLGATGGTGTIRLLTLKGQIFDTGTISISRRLPVTP